MPFVDLSEFLTENDLVVEGLGPRAYSIPAPDAETGLRYTALANIARKAAKGEEISDTDVQSLRLDDAEEKEFVNQILGDEVLAQMVEDNLPWPAITRTAQYAFTHFAVSADAARKAFEAGAFSGKAQMPQNRAARRATQSGRQASPASRTPRKSPGSTGTRSSTSGGSSK
jgi:hypothetical protein